MSKSFHPEVVHLSNGIPVILQNSDGPVASFYWWNQVGAADERPREAGFAHFLEHMHFKDTDAKASGKASSGELARAIESLGGDVNAYTSFDQTVYHVTCASHHWEKVIRVFSKMAKPQRFLKQDFDREREVILEELKKNEDAPGRVLFQSLFSATFASHPYGRPVIGFRKTLKAARVSDLEGFYRRLYVSGNMGLILVGPFDEARKKKLIAELEKNFGRKVLPKKAPVHERRRAEPELRKEPQFRSVPFDVTTPSFAVSFRVPALQHEDMPALDVLAGVLGMGESCRLYQALFYGKSIVNDVGGGLYVPKDPGMLYFNADVEKSENVAKAYEGLLGELNRLQVDAPTLEEIARVVTTTESERYYALQTADGIASRIGFLQFQMGNLDYDDQYLEQLKKVTPTDVQKVARYYLDPRRLSFTVMFPKKEEKFDLEPIQKFTQELLKSPQEFHDRIEELEAKKPKKGKAKSDSSSDPLDWLPHSIRLPSGVRVVYRERKQSHVVSLQAVVLGGLRLEVADPIRSADVDLGASHLLASIWAKGTQKRTSQEVTAMVENLAAGLDGFSGRNTIGLSSTGLARDWKSLSELFLEVLLEPAFNREELDLSRKVVEDSIRSLEDHSSALCSRLFHETLFETHPYGKPATGTLESIAQIDTEILRSYHQRWVRPENLVLSVVGNVSRSDLEIWLSELDRRFARSSLIKGASSLRLEDEKWPTAPRWVDRRFGREQVHILSGSLGLRFSDQERHAMRLAQNVLGGQSGRLFIELREKRSMAYSVSPVSMEGIERGYIGTYIGCSPSKQQEALKGIRKVLEDLAQKGPTEREMDRAKEYALGRRAMDLQGDSSLAGYYALETVYDLPIRSENEIAQTIEKVTAQQVRDFVRKYWIEPQAVTVVVG